VWNNDIGASGGGISDVFDPSVSLLKTLNAAEIPGFVWLSEF
jgi:hypothetical protein